MLRKPVVSIFWPGRRLSRRSASLIALYLLPVVLLVCLLAAKLTPLALTVMGGAHSLHGKRITIDPGHGGTDPGAMYKGVYEKDINLAVSLKVADLLRKKGATVYLTRTEDVDLYRSGIHGTRKELKRWELNQRVQIAEKHSSNLFLSIHTNRDRHASCYGAQTFYHPMSVNGKQAAESLQEQLRVLQPRNKRLAKSGDYYVLRNSAMTALLLEIGFITHQEERAVLQQADYQSKLANSIVQGLENFYANVSTGKQTANSSAIPKEPVNSLAVLSQQEPNQQTDQEPSQPAQPVSGLPLQGQADPSGYKLFFNRQTEDGDQLALEFHSDGTSRDTELPALAGSIVSSGENPTATRAALALEALIQGPREPGLESLIPQGTRLLGVDVKGSLLTVRFSRELTENFTGSIEDENNLVLAVCKTVTQFPGITNLVIQVENGAKDTLGGHVLLGDVTNLQQLQKKARIAIVIDDLGQNFRGTSEIMSLPYHLTMAIMPNMQNSREEAKKAVSLGHQVIIHMPMAPERGKAGLLGPGALTCDLSDGQILSRVRCAIDQMPQAAGLSNHTGSRVTADRRIMELVVKELKARKLFILDSRTTEKTVIPEVANRFNLPYAERNVFLDNVHQVGPITKQLNLLVRMAHQRGSAIGIGHVGTGGRKMYQALQNWLPQLEAEGIELVPVSELLIK